MGLVFLFSILLVCGRLFPLVAAESPIAHFIVLMMENRSFDHILGFLHLHRPEVDGLTGNEYNYVNLSQPDSSIVYVNNNPFDTGPDDPCHSFDCTTEQIYGSSNPPPGTVAAMNGFVQNAVGLGNTGLLLNPVVGLNSCSM
jgi:phospholipase C